MSGVGRWATGLPCPLCWAAVAARTAAKGDHQVCAHQYQPGFTGWGSFAEYVALPYADMNLVQIPEELDYASVASLGCRFATSFRAVVVQGRVRPGEWVAVHGCGGVGLSAIMIAASIGAHVIAVDVKPEALDLAKSLGATHTIDARDVPDVARAIQDLTQRRRACVAGCFGQRHDGPQLDFGITPPGTPCAGGVIGR